MNLNPGLWIIGKICPVEMLRPKKIWKPTPWKINMEPTNHPFRKENELPNLHDYVPAINLQGCISKTTSLNPPPPCSLGAVRRLLGRWCHDTMPGHGTGWCQWSFAWPRAIGCLDVDRFTVDLGVPWVGQMVAILSFCGSRNCYRLRMVEVKN